ncbi:MAG: response regulator, partial [Myxococcota bacterium]
MPRILVVDDSAVMREMMINVVMEAGYEGSEFVEAADGAAGLERLRKKSVDLILSDLHMPNMDGIQFLQAVRAESIAVPF